MAQPATAKERRESAAGTPLKLVDPADLVQQTEALNDSIARRAFEIFECNGRVIGRHLEDWFRAEAELLHPVRVHITDFNDCINARAEVPGFAAEDLKMSVDGSRLTITGKKEAQEERKDGKTVYREFCSDDLFRIINLPAEVDPAGVKATLKDGLLVLDMPKAKKPG